MGADPHAVLENYLASLAFERGLADNTIAAYRRDLRQYLQFVGEDPVGAAAVGAFLEWLAELGLSPESVARKLAAVKGYHRFLCEEENAFE